ncbi:pyridoxal kinase [Neomegalonema sp.]|uniref:pyridoxal kinase n=1 Tax=Neomegalonema sp. TaxID=2039713 RepID=UPI00260A1190|nr:pyridoxal kinase [Neomegalonema sp.]MDD2869315.1 pyridoxal kinase [Neomegalonema sp.]
MKRVISIQSQVSWGHVGNSAAVFPMQAKGVEVVAVPTALLSNHPHYPTMRGRILPADLVADLLRGVEERGLVDGDAIILSGYLGSPETAHVVSEFILRARLRHPEIRHVCDPVMGDDDLGAFVKEELISVFRERLVPLASLITPNQYELELLTGERARSLSGIRTAMRAFGREIDAVVTGCVLEEGVPGHVESVAWSAGEISRTSVERLLIRPCGTGDLFTGLLVARLACGVPLAEAAARATAEIHAVLERTRAAGTEEMRIIGFPFASNP